MDKILVTGENREYYMNLVPADLVHMMYEPEYITVGGYETEGKKAVPVAVMIASGFSIPASFRTLSEVMVAAFNSLPILLASIGGIMSLESFSCSISSMTLSATTL